ncbi:MAG: putative signal transduction protein with domain [Myxococcaceae bacterium]|nr:putative signal transduction protein with domain [Myxococcaceae bacterium]
MVSWAFMPLISTIMSSRVISVTPRLPLCALIRLLADENIGGAPVVDETGRPVGIVSKSDLIFDDYDVICTCDRTEVSSTGKGRVHWQKVAGSRVSEHGELFDGRNFATSTVADVMTSNPLVVLPTATISETSELMVKRRIHRVPVVDENAQLVGMVTTFDITRWVARGA